MSNKSPGGRRTRRTLAYPKRSLKDCLQIAEAIREYNAGKPYDILDLAKAVKRSKGSSEFRMLITGSTQFGLTEGSYNAKTISLSQLGRSLVFPESPQERTVSIRKALFSIPFYKKFFEDFDKNKLPTVQYLEGTLNRKYGIPVQDCKDCYNLIVKNGKELGILQEDSGSDWINLSKLASPAPTGEGTSPIPTTTDGAKTPQVPPPVVGLATSREEGVRVNVNVNFELPITKDADVYDKIFRSLKKNILTSDSKED